jgi:16S rRNA (guanine(1405)-N(7))-methyltransferase
MIWGIDKAPWSSQGCQNSRSLAVVPEKSLKMTGLDLVYQKLKESKKYRNLCDDTLYRISAWAIKRFEGKKAVKAAKSKLHQVYAAYMEAFHPAKIQKLLDKLPAEPDLETLNTTALQILKSHASSSERLLFMDQFYHDLFQGIEKPRKLIDLACGLNPFTVSWMNFGPEVEYYAYDIDTRLVSLINTFFSYRSGVYKAECLDLLVSVPAIEADVVFLFKALPCLEQQEKGAGEKLFSSLSARHMVISFPTKSLTGKSKGMENHYQTYAANLIRRHNLEFFKLVYPTEIFYVIKK